MHEKTRTIEIVAIQYSACEVQLILLGHKLDKGERLKNKLYDKCDDFTFSIVNFPFISSYIPGSPAYGFYI